MNPPEPDARGEDLGERPKIHDPVEVSFFLLQRRERWKRLALEAEHPVRIVLDDYKVELARHLQQLPAPLCDHSHPGGVLEVRHGIDELDVEALRSGLLQRLTGGDGDNAGAVYRDVGYA